MKHITDLSQPSGRENGVRWYTRQLTGKPFVTRGYVEVEKDKWMSCGHDHRKSMTARRCAAALARKFAR